MKRRTSGALCSAAAVGVDVLGTHQVDAEPKLVGVGPKLVGVESLGRGLHRSVVGTTYVNDRSWHWPTPVSRGSKREALRCCPPSQSPSAVSFQMSAQLLGIERQSWQTQMLGSTSEQQAAASLPIHRRPKFAC